MPPISFPTFALIKSIGLFSILHRPIAALLAFPLEFKIRTSLPVSNSDKYFVFICMECNLPAIANPDTNIYECKNCNNYKKFKKINIPYSCKLLMQELQCMSIAPRFITNS